MKHFSEKSQLKNEPVVSLSTKPNPYVLPSDVCWCKNALQDLKKYIYAIEHFNQIPLVCSCLTCIKKRQHDFCWSEHFIQFSLQDHNFDHVSMQSLQTGFCMKTFIVIQEMHRFQISAYVGLLCIHFLNTYAFFLLLTHGHIKVINGICFYKAFFYLSACR